MERIMINGKPIPKKLQAYMEHLLEVDRRAMKELEQSFRAQFGSVKDNREVLSSVFGSPCPSTARQPGDLGQ